MKQIIAYKLSDGTIVESENLARDKQSEIDKRFVKIEITAKVTTTVELRKGETIEDIKSRDVDIYLSNNWDSNPLLFMSEKIDLGVNESTIKILS